MHFAAQHSGQEQKIGLQTFERETTYRQCVANEVYKIVTPSFQYAEPMRLLMVVQLHEYQNVGATTISLTDESKEQNTYLSFELVFEFSYSSKGSSWKSGGSFIIYIDGQDGGVTIPSTRRFSLPSTKRRTTAFEIHCPTGLMPMTYYVVDLCYDFPYKNKIPLGIW